MSFEVDPAPARDVGLYLWLKQATEGLSDEDERRVREETTEHFVLAFEELRREGLPEADARLEAVARLGDPSKANVDLIRSHFRRADNRWIGSPGTRLWFGPLCTLYLGWLGWSFYAAAEPSNPGLTYLAMAVTLIAAWGASIAAYRGSYVAWAISGGTALIAFIGLGYTLPERQNPWILTMLIPIYLWPMLRLLRRMPLSSD